MYDELDKYEVATKLALQQPNLNILASDGGVISGQSVKWMQHDAKPIDETVDQSVTVNVHGQNDSEGDSENIFALGDFNKFGQFLQQLVGESWQKWGDLNSAT